MARSAEIFGLYLPKWLEIAQNLSNLTVFRDQPPRIARSMEVPPQYRGPPTFPQNLAPGGGHLPVSPPK